MKKNSIKENKNSILIVDGKFYKIKLLISNEDWSNGAPMQH